ncbi:TolC family protein [Pseudoduganella sp. OTU4001]|uniref:TolC family protein n=1 Tax=Pseudoduganella sp. OTU4001 TaxID=3043854 RepID=UPI00313C2E63
MFSLINLSLRRRVALACLLAFGATMATAAPRSLTLAQAQARALERSRQLAARGHAIAAADDMTVAAAQLPDPVLKAGIDNLPVGGPERFKLGADFMTMRRIGIMQELTSSEKQRWRALRFAREADRSRAEAAVVTAAIERDTAIAWLDRYYLDRMLRELTEQTRQARDEIAAAQAAFRGGRSTPASVLEARVALLALENRASELEGQARSAAIMLARWTDLPVDTVLTGEPDTSAVSIDPGSLDVTLAHHPKVAVLARQADLAQAEAELARANRHADWSVEIALQQRGSGYPNMVSFGVSVPLQWDRKRRQDRETSAKLAEADQAQAERDEALREHIAEVRGQLAEWQSGRTRIARYRQELVPLASERTASVLAAYRGGKASLVDVLSAQRAESELRLQALQLERENARVWAQLTFIAPISASAQDGAVTLKRVNP